MFCFKNREEPHLNNLWISSEDFKTKLKIILKFIYWFAPASNEIKKRMWFIKCFGSATKIWQSHRIKNYKCKCPRKENLKQNCQTMRRVLRPDSPSLHPKHTAPPERPKLKKECPNSSAQSRLPHPSAERRAPIFQSKQTSAVSLQLGSLHRCKYIVSILFLSIYMCV